MHLSHTPNVCTVSELFSSRPTVSVSVRLAGGVGINKGTEQSLKDLEHLPDQFLLSVSPLLFYDIFVPGWVASF